MTRLLCVCLGNICRSPTAEAVLRSLGPDTLHVDSAGTGDWHLGAPPYGPAIKAAANRGYDLTPLRARQICIADFRDFDIILAMDKKNFADIEALHPGDAPTRVALFLDYAGESGMTEIPDPYFTRDFDGALDLIEMAATGLLAALAGE